MVLGDHGAEDIGEMLVQRARLAVVLEVGGELRDAVHQLVRGDIQGSGKAREDRAVAVAEGHLVAIPERVHVVLAEMHV